MKPRRMTAEEAKQCASMASGNNSCGRCFQSVNWELTFYQEMERLARAVFDCKNPENPTAKEMVSGAKALDNLEVYLKNNPRGMGKVIK